MNDTFVTPFLKWAGGKRWLTNSYPEIFPHEFDRYIEPFLGSGAVFFKINPNNALLSDSNHHLIDTYAAIKRNHRLVERYLQEHDSKHSKRHYYKVRSESSVSIFRRAARFIYLNRTCWNALYRVNQKGEFNVPIGTKTSAQLPTDNFGAIAEYLSRAELRHSDFEKTVANAKNGDFVFVDPVVSENTNDPLMPPADGSS